MTETNLRDFIEYLQEGFDKSNATTPQEMGKELSDLMDNVEADNYYGTAQDGDPRMMQIERLANYLAWFYPDQLDPRINANDGVWTAKHNEQKGN